MTVVAFLIGVVGMTAVRGITIDQFWDWFLIDPSAPFHGMLPAITTAEALGLSILVTVFVYSSTGSDADREANEGKSSGEQMAEELGKAMLFYAFIWVFAIIIKSWV